jgi:hypothetical protein
MEKCWILPLFFWGVLARGATIVVPAVPAVEETRAAAILAEVWTRGTGERALIVGESAPAPAIGSGPFFLVGETAAGRALAPLPALLDRDGFRVRAAGDGRVVIRGATASATEFAAGWYAQHAMGVRWFIPGDLGEAVPDLRGWVPAAADRVVEPAFLSRDLGLGLSTDESWKRVNGLHARLPHGHALAGIFPATLFDSHPDWFPVLEGRRYRPASAKDTGWQPNLALPAVAAHAAEAANVRFDRNPQEEGFSVSINDSTRFDQTEATVRARGPLRWFRGRPDYSDLVFGFVNRVADAVEIAHPGRRIDAYAYKWCENAPTFRVRPNVVPWLTADRTQGYSAAFKAEDQALIGRWCRSGARMVGIYDYLYGAPFLVPRVTPRLTAESVAFAYRAGARAYYAEACPNWALEGPRLWIVTQLLWDPTQSVEALLDEYYARFWAEAAAPMRRFYGQCEAVWEGQPGPPWWIKFYQDEDQVVLFPARVRTALRADIEEARRVARDPAVRARVGMASAGFEVTERFAEFCEARTAWPLAVEDYRRKRRAFVEADARAVAVGAMAKTDLDVYLWDDPSWEGEGAEGGGSKWIPLAGPGPQAHSLAAADFAWRTLKGPGRLDDRTSVWSAAPWLGRGSPAEGRTIKVIQAPATPQASGGGSPHAVFYSHCKDERLQQWIPLRDPAFGLAPGVFRLSVRVRGLVSPGNQVYVMMNWLDARSEYVGRPAADRLPDGDWSAGRTLVAAGQPPAGAAFLGVGVCVSNQTGKDWTEFAGMSLERER